MPGPRTIWIAFALAVLSVVAVIDARMTDALLTTLRWVEHTHQVIEAIDDIGASMGAARRARRAFLLTAEPENATEYATSIEMARTRLRELRALVVDSEAQTVRVGALDTAFAARVALLDADIEARKAGVSLLNDPAAMQRNSDAAARVDAVLGEMHQSERYLLHQREAATEARVTATRTLLLLGTALGFAILLGAFLGMRRENARRRASEAELRDHKEALRDANAFLDSVIENLPAMLFVKDAKEFRFTRVNHAAEQLLGLSRAELLGKNDLDFFPVEQAEAFRAKDRATFESDEVVDIAEEPIETRHGRRWLHTMKVPIRDEDGAPAFLLGISEDITEKKRVAEDLRRAKDLAEAANRELESFSYSVAHDLRAPLRSIDGFSAVLMEDYADELDAEGLEHLGRIRSGSKRMAELIDDLLGLSRMARRVLARAPVDVGCVARAVAADLRATDPSRHVAFAIPEGLCAEADPGLLRILLENLMGNAWKFSAKKASARIELGTLGGAFYVRDDGAGFDMAYAGKLFGVFQRLHAVAEFDGSGIGLATVQRIVRRHGGRIWAESKVDQGATFFFTLSESESTA